MPSADLTLQLGNQADWRARWWGSADLSPIDTCRKGVFSEDSSAYCTILRPQTTGRYFNNRARLGGVLVTCTQVQIPHVRMYLEERATRHIHAIHAVGFLGGGVFKSESQSSLTSSTSSTLS